MDTTNWHTISLSIPFPSPANALLVKRVIEVDALLRPLETSRMLTVIDSSLALEFKAATVSQARVAMDHCLSDLQLIVQTMHKFGPQNVEGAKDGGEKSMEVGLMGSWEGTTR